MAASTFPRAADEIDGLGSPSQIVEKLVRLHSFFSPVLYISPARCLLTVGLHLQDIQVSTFPASSK